MLLLWCFSGLHYVVHLWFKLCDCLCMPLCYIYARFYDISIGHYTWFVVTCNELTHDVLCDTACVSRLHGLSKMVCNSLDLSVLTSEE
jgi:hypothetical protein